MKLKTVFPCRSLALAVCCLAVWSAPVWPAEVDTSSEVRVWLELGTGAVANGNGRFGEYARLYQTSGLKGIANLGLQWRDGDDRYRYGTLEAGSDVDYLGLDARYGRQGDYRIGFGYRQIETVTMGDVRTVYPERGRFHRLPEGYSGPDSALPLRTHLGVRRDRFSLDLSRRIGDWELAAEFGSELKEGNRLTAGSERFGGAAFLFEPVDYRHDTIDLRATHQADAWVVNTRWYYSRFRNDESVLTFQNSFDTAAPERAIDLAPDNRFSRFGVDGLYSFSPRHQLSWFASYGDSRQDDPWLEVVTGPGLVVIDSLDARRVDTDLRLAFRGQPGPRFGYRLDWQYRDRDNRTDVIQLSPTSFSNVYDLRRERWSAQGHYRLPHRMRLRGGVVYTEVDRTTLSGERFRDHADDTRLWAELRMPRIGRLDWTVAVETTDRDSDLSEHRRAVLNVESPSQALPEYLIPGRNWQYQVRTTAPINDRVAVGASYRHVNDDFDNDFYGLRSRRSDEVSLDLSWQISDEVAMATYGQYQNYRFSQDGFEFGPAGSFANAPWRFDTRDTTYTVGANLQWQLRPDLDWRVEISHTDNDSSYRSRWLDDTDTGELAGSRDSLPGWGVDVQRLDSSLDWRYNTRTSWRLRYVYERYRSDDWAWQREDFARHGFAWASPSHDSHAILVSVRYQWLDF